MVNTNRPRENGVALLLVMTTILLVVLAANIVLGIVSSQSRLTKHQIGKIQGYYASLAGINLGYENLRIGAAGWPIPATIANNYQRRICRAAGAGCNIIEATLPASIQNVTVFVRRRNSGPVGNVPACNPPAGVNVCIHAVADYTFN